MGLFLNILNIQMRISAMYKDKCAYFFKFSLLRRVDAKSLIKLIPNIYKLKLNILIFGGN